MIYFNHRKEVVEVLKKAISIPDDLFESVHNFIDCFYRDSGVKLSFSGAVAYLVQRGLRSYWGD